MAARRLSAKAVNVEVIREEGEESNSWNLFCRVPSPRHVTLRSRRFNVSGDPLLFRNGNMTISSAYTGVMKLVL